jgi:hypothetical protein
MQAGRLALIVAGTAMLMLAACESGEPSLMNLRSSGEGPDEFAILPPKALETPENYTDLPEPTLGGSNRTDPTPEADAIAALGGRESAATGVPAGDGGLVNHASRFGRAGEIRQTLAGEDLQYRRDNNGRVLERLFNVNVYYRAYDRQSLDQQAELRRWRRTGIKTPSAPPPLPGE